MLLHICVFAVLPPLAPTVRWSKSGKTLGGLVMLGCLVYVRILHIVLIDKMSDNCVQVQAQVGQFIVDYSLHSKAAGFLHSCKEFLIELLVRLIGRNVYSVKTCVSLG